MELWGLKTCDTCRKALAALPGATFRDVRAQPLTGAEIAALLARFGPALRMSSGRRLANPLCR